MVWLKSIGYTVLWVVFGCTVAEVSQTQKPDFDVEVTNHTNNLSHQLRVLDEVNGLDNKQTSKAECSHYHGSSDTKNVTNTSNVYITFTQNWKNEECFGKKGNQNCDNISAWVTIHGLWPSFFSDSSNTHQEPSYCRPIQLQPSDLTSILPSLSHSWPSYDTDNFHFWKHEWEKHGTCWFTNTPLEYFQTGLNYYMRYNVSELMIKHNIKPGVFYDFEMIKRIFSDGWDKTAFVQCTENDKQYIEAFKSCFDWKGALIDCPLSIPNGNNCAKKVIFST